MAKPMNMAQVMDLNAKGRERPKHFELEEIRIRPERDRDGRPVKNGGHVVHTLMREKGDEYGARREAEKPFGAGEHEKMLAHVANELKLPEPKDGEGDEDEKGSEGAAY